MFTSVFNLAISQNNEIAVFVLMLNIKAYLISKSITINNLVQFTLFKKVFPALKCVKDLGTYTFDTKLQYLLSFL